MPKSHKYHRCFDPWREWGIRRIGKKSLFDVMTPPLLNNRFLPFGHQHLLVVDPSMDLSPQKKLGVALASR